MSADSITPFTFESLPVRGALIHLERSWRRMQRDHNYDAVVTETLAHAASATGLIAHSLKFDGAITLQIQGGGPLQMLVMQCTSELELRGMASTASNSSTSNFLQLTEGAHCAITIDTGEQPYQGIVAIEGDSLSSSLEAYFRRSVQVPSHVALVGNGEVAGGLLLQQMPGQSMDEDDWNRLGFLAATLSAGDLDGEAGIELIAKIFAEDEIRVHEARPVDFRCRCSDQKVEDLLQLIGEEESRAALDEQQKLEVVCEYCGQKRTFDAVDVTRIFSANTIPGSESLQ